MQKLAQLPIRAGETTSLWRIERLDTSFRNRECRFQVVLVRKHSPELSCSLFSTSFPSSSSSLSGCQLPRTFVHPRWRRGSPRVLCMEDDTVSKSELEELPDIVLNEITRGKDSTSEKVEASYFSELKLEEIAKTPAPVAGEFKARNPFDLRWIGAWADALTERGMLKRRTFYSHDDWLRHRSSTRHYRHFASSFSSRAILSLIPPVGTMTAISVFVALYNTVVLSGWLPSFFPIFHASSLSYQLTAPALALLLVFRTEASYSRYDEARKTWTEVISSSKDMARQALAWSQHPADHRKKKLLLDYILAFPVALKCHLLYDSDIAEELREILEEDDLALVLKAEHRPNCLIQLMTLSLKSIKFEDGEGMQLDANISQFNESISVCERLIRTPIPLAYTRLTSRILVLWHLSLPVVLWDDCHWVVVPATFISAASLFCIEEVGVLIEEPFPILALDRMCAKARENILEFADLQVKAQVHLSNKTRKSQSKVVTNGATTQS
ncbi:voltage-dependent chloride channel 1, chloroplastic [Physcomitrium patens]|uniref:Uncharacterized protein n=1 Tax=Physcomitrium patens TaxID=3218 RepID=A0A2K1KNM1_PHYPA|nr:UPF0187 protein At3g61320, chloroplastic-like isoform X1 [Physcomitrium patens]PNR55383.1 hypothetical protein PHYPA_006280 [Physcomitrium patens]|eukprot:XP_024373551.1 UPF0187 protein At3g61320, chloroplastic-like isoform X1 [Physcomitrella patens]